MSTSVLDFYLALRVVYMLYATCGHTLLAGCKEEEHTTTAELEEAAMAGTSKAANSKFIDPGVSQDDEFNQ